MEIKHRSFFKKPEADALWFENWASRLAQLNNRNYEKIQIRTSLGNTHIWGMDSSDENAETLIIFPGARTTPLFWDFDRNLDHLGKMRIFMVETNGLPNPSDGNTPDIKGLGYGEWVAEIFEKLKIEKAFIAGASFGGLIGMKAAIVIPEKTKAVFLLNPGCLQSFSLRFSNLYYNLLPIIIPNKKNISKFLDKAVFCKPNHGLSEASEKLLIDYELFAITRYHDNTQKPYYMDRQLSDVTVPVYLLEGDKDLLFPAQKSISNAKEKIRTLKDIVLFENVGHGIETYDKAIQYIASIIKDPENS